SSDLGTRWVLPLASTVKARGRAQRVPRTVMGTSFGRWRSILLAPTAVNVERARRGEGAGEVGAMRTETAARLGSERPNVKKERQALPAAVLRVLYRAVRHRRLA